MYDYLVGGPGLDGAIAHEAKAHGKSVFGSGQASEYCG